MLPYAPLHHLLLRRRRRAARADERQRLRRADRLPRRGRARAPARRSPTASCVHDRPIHTRTDDSVVRVVAVPRARPLLLRRSRGYVPASLAAAGARRAAAAGLRRGAQGGVLRGQGRAGVGRRTTSATSRTTRRSRSFAEGVEHFERLFAVAPGGRRARPASRLPVDALRARARRRRARRRPAPPRAPRRVPRRARRAGPAVGAIFDGTGYGPDGTVWGGELLVGGLAATRARATWRPCACRAATRAVREPWRMACAWLLARGRRDARDAARARRRAWTRRAGPRSRAWRRSGLAAPVTTSAGRLFDAVAALCGLRARGDLRGPGGDRARGGVRPGRARGLRDPPRTATRSCSTRGRRCSPRPPTPPPASRSRPSRRASTTALACATAGACARLAGRHGLGTVVLSGGVFQNRLLLEATAAALAARRAARARPRAPAAQRRRDRVRAGGDRRGSRRRLARSR